MDSADMDSADMDSADMDSADMDSADILDLSPANPFLDAGSAATLDGIEEGDALAGLALDLRRSWSHRPDELWAHLDPELWRLTSNPWVVLQTTSRRELRARLDRPEVRQRLARQLARQRGHFDHVTWFAAQNGTDQLSTVAYFSMEYMVSESLPIYSGGLGNVAGDQLKAASDLGVPVAAVGLLYQQGYFRQVLRSDGSQDALYPYNDPTQLPIVPVRDAEGEWLRVRVPHPSGRLWARAWKAQVGRLSLYLLDTNDPATQPTLRGVASELYGGGPETRLAQELVLGVGGWRLLSELGIEPEVCHLNEGHAALAVLERARMYADRTGLGFDDALAVTRAGNLFTTHTPVDAGFDRFPPELVERWLGPYARDELGIDTEALLARGRPPDRAHHGDEPFTMAFLALHASRAVNGVSRLHGQVSRELFAPLFPRWPVAEVPIGHVTNGIHVPSWDSEEADDLWQSVCGPGRWYATRPQATDPIATASDEAIWAMRGQARAALVGYARERLGEQLALSGAPAHELAAAARLFDPDVLTIGFARRFAAYKRPHLLLHHEDRLVRLLSDAERPVQLVVAGKAHPADDGGKELVRAWSRFARRPELAGRVAFLADYDLMLTKHLVQGVDVWLNTPLRPWEASGTSGMKVLVNGGLNLSALDGWWAEAHDPELGWALEGAGDDEREADRLYHLLEHEIRGPFYDRDDAGIPRSWVGRVRRSMAELTPRFSADRTVREYTAAYYLPLARAYRERIADGGRLGRELAGWGRRTREALAVHVARRSLQPDAGGGVAVEIHLHFGDLPRSDVRVEFYADRDGSGAPAGAVEAEWLGPLVGAANGHAYRAVLPSGRDPADFTPRLVPWHPSAAVPLENPAIVWLG